LPNSKEKRLLRPIPTCFYSWLEFVLIFKSSSVIGTL